MNGALAMLGICLDSDLILRSATENSTEICDVVKQHSISGSELNASFVT